MMQHVGKLGALDVKTHVSDSVACEDNKPETVPLSLMIPLVFSAVLYLCTNVL
jgi:hypothetical protein